MTVLELVDICSRLGLGTACLLAVIYLSKHRDTLEQRADLEHKKREEYNLSIISAKDTYIQTVMYEAILRNTESNNNLAAAQETLSKTIERLYAKENKDD